MVFVTKICQAIKNDINAAVMNGSVPEERDGHELHCLIANKANSAASISAIRKQPRSARAKDYKNTLLTTNLL